MHKRIICAMLALLSLLICPGFAAKEQATLPPFPDGYSLGSHTPAPTLPEEPEVLGPQPGRHTEEGTPVPTPVPEQAEPTPLWENLTPEPWLGTPMPTLPPVQEKTSAYEQLFGVTEEELVLAARVAYLEAGSREKGIQAVLTVIYNRCMAASFGGEETTIEEEVYRKGQFSVIHHRRFDKIQPPEEYVEIARQVFYYGESYLPENVLFFCARRLGKGWGGRKFYKEIGGNLFFYGRVE